MKRIFLFLVVNIAAVATLTIVATIVCGLLGVDLAAELGEGGYGTGGRDAALAETDERRKRVEAVDADVERWKKEVEQPVTLKQVSH